MDDRKPFKLRLVKVASETATVRRFVLVNHSGDELPKFTPGAHIDIRLNESLGTRSYSLAGDPADHQYYTLGVLLETGGSGGSSFMHGLREGAIVEASGPYNNFSLVSDAATYHLIAGGIGITPILSMLHTLNREGRDFAVHYCCRSREEMAFREDVIALAGKRAALYYDNGDPRIGPNLELILKAPCHNEHVYVCGPSGMIDAVRGIAEKNGWPSGRIHYEVFTQPKASDADQSFEVVLARSGVNFTVPANRTILEVLVEAGQPVEFDCRRGECGSCVVPVLEGELDHRDYYLTAKERAAGKEMCICVSRCRGKRLVLDL